MHKPSLIFLLLLLFSVFGCYRESDNTLDAYMEIVNKMKANNSSLDHNIHSKIIWMKDEFKRKSDFIPLYKAAKDIFDIIREFNAYLDDVNERFYTLTGGEMQESSYNYFYDGEKNKLRNKKLVNDFFINGYEDKYGRWIAPEGLKISHKITETRNKVIAILNHLSNEKNFAISDNEIDQFFSDKWLLSNINMPKSSNNNWVENTFGNQSVAAAYVTLIMLQNDALLSAQMAVYYLSAKVGTVIIKFNKFSVVSSPKKSQVIKGEPFETEIFLAQTSFHTLVTAKVNGKEVEVEKGIATYKVPSAKCGEHTYKAEITLKNPYSNRTETYKKTFKYEVGERCY